MFTYLLHFHQEKQADLTLIQSNIVVNCCRTHYCVHQLEIQFILSVWILNLINIINLFVWDFQLSQSSWDCENINRDFIFFEYKCCSFIKIDSIIDSKEVLNSLNQWVLIVRNNQQNINIKHLSNQLFWMILNRELWSDRHVEMLQILSNFIHLCKTTSDNTGNLRWFKTLL